MTTGKALVIKTSDGQTHRFDVACETTTSLFWLYITTKSGEKLAAFRKSKVDSILVDR